LEKRINKLLKIFKKRTKVIACSVLERDGFVIASLKDDFIDDNLYDKKIIDLYNALETMSNANSDLIDFNNKRVLISMGVVDEFLNNGFMIFIKAIGNSIIFITVFPKLLNLKPITNEFEKIVEQLSVYFLEAENQGILNKFYKLA
ncbi:MAG: hypothetical protein ACFFAN_08920, partial [Promethearchaeota archaeon]